MKDQNLRRRSSALGDIALAALLVVLPAKIAHATKTTTVQGVVYRLNGNTASGILVVSWPDFTTASNEKVKAGSTTTTIGEDGSVSLNLVPNVGVAPATIRYTATFHFRDGIERTEYWNVPAQAITGISTLRSDVTSSTPPVQSVTDGYIAATISNVNQQYVFLRNPGLSSRTDFIAKLLSNTAYCNGPPLPCTVMIGPAYGNEEPYTSGSFPGPSRLHMEDYRKGQKVDYYHNWASGRIFGNDYGPGLEIWGRLDGATQGTQSFTDITLEGLSPGYSIGNPGVGPQMGWQTHKALNITEIEYGEGITEAFNNRVIKHGAGDVTGPYSYVISDGGWTAASDEGAKPFAGNVTEEQGRYTGTVTSGAGTGLTSVKTKGLTSSGSQGVGQFAIDLSQPPVATTVIAVSNTSNYSKVVVSAPVPVSNAYGFTGGAGGALTPPLNINPPFTTEAAVSVKTGVTGLFDTSHLACFTKGIAHECFIPNAVGSTMVGTTCTGIPVANAPQCVAGHIRRTHLSGSLLMQGGMAGYGVEAPNETTTQNGQPIRHMSEVVGSIDANTIIVQSWQTLNSKPAFNISNPTFINISSISSTGTTVTITYNPIGSTVYQPWNTLSGRSIAIAAASDSSLNTTCTDLTWASTKATANCTIAGLMGTHSATTATGRTGPQSIKLYPMAEVLDVQNHTSTPPSVDGTLTLEPNVLTVVNGDTLEVTHHMSALFQGETLFVATSNYHASGGGLSVVTEGIGNGLAPTGGFLLNLKSTPLPGQSPPDMVHMIGPYSYGLYFDHMGSLPSGALIQANCAAAQAADVNYIAPVYQVLGNGASAHSLSVNCNTGADTIQTPGTLTLSNTGTVFTSAVSAPQVTATSGSATNTFAGSTTINNLGTTGNGNFGGSNTVNNPTFTGTLTLPATGVSAGSYTNPSMSVGADGRVTSISSGSGGGGFPSVVAHTALTAQTGPVAPLFSYTPPSAGLFRLTIVAYTTAAGGTACNLRGGAYLTPVAGHTIGNGMSVACTAAYNYTTATFTARNAAGSAIAPNINISGTPGSLQYMVDAVLEQLQ